MKTKKERKFFTVFEYDKEQEYLRKQHKNGWKFVKVTGLGMYHFEECNQEDVVYQLDYNQESSANKEEYIKLFLDCGWEYIQDYMGYSYFRKSITDEKIDESIFCDESSRLDMIERVYKGKMLPLVLILSACILPQFVINLLNGRYIVALIMGIIIAIISIVFGYCTVQYNNKKRG